MILALKKKQATSVVTSKMQINGACWPMALLPYGVGSGPDVWTSTRSEGEAPGSGCASPVGGGPRYWPHAQGSFTFRNGPKAPGKTESEARSAGHIRKPRRRRERPSRS